MRYLGRYVTDKSGNVAITFALCVTVLLLVIGVALDYARAVRIKWTLQAATDAAVIMVSNSQKSDSESRTLAQTMLNANAKFPVTIKSLVLPDANTVNKTTKLLSTYTLPTMIMSIFGIPTMTVDAYAAATRSVQKLDVVFVLDNSGSMTTDNRMSILIKAATDAVEALSKNGPNLRIGLVPFNELVNVGPQYRNANWIDGAAPWEHLVSAKRKDGSMSSVNRFDLLDAMGMQWKGCVEARTANYDVTDDPPNVSIPATLFAPAFVPDDPGPTPKVDAYYNIFAATNSYDAFLNHYVDDNGDCATAASGDENNTQAMTAAQLQARTARTCKYFKNTVNKTYVARGVSNLPVMGPSASCTIRPVMRLTKDYAAIKTAIAAMFATGGTNITEGTAWGLRLLSNKAPFADGMTDGEIATGGHRYMIVMTDGKNSSDPVINFHGSTFTAYGYKNDSGKRLENFSQQPSTSDVGYAPLNARLKIVCANARKSGIEIYTIGVGVDDANKPPLQDCVANKTDRAIFMDKPEGLGSVFQKIVGDISVPYLSN